MSPKHGRFAQVVALFVKQPRTVNELREALDVTSKEQPYRYIRALRSEGLLYVSEWRRCGSTDTPVYAWQPSVCHYSDARKPA